MRVLIRWVGLFLLVAVCSAAAGSLMGTWQSTGYRWGKAHTPRLPASASAQVRPHRGKSYGSTPDLQGNPITPAIATYGFDALGGSVEQHYPDTRVTPLRSPEG